MREEFAVDAALEYIEDGGQASYPTKVLPPTAARARVAAAARPTHIDTREFVALADRLRDRTPSRYERWVKPALDRVLAALMIALLTPVLLLLAVLVLLRIGSPILFPQARVGRSGRPFSMLKFRTMHPDRRVSTEPYIGPERRMTHKSPHDPRHTVIGRWMRKLSLDELPQLFNVVRGEMSLVGPRPELVALTANYEPWQETRHMVKPGLTGLWQTTERSEGRPLHECIHLDLQYIDELSFTRDCAILLRTPLALLRNKGVI